MNFVLGIKCCNCAGYMELTEKGESFDHLECPSCKQPIPVSEIQSIKNTFDGLKGLRTSITDKGKILFNIGLKVDN